MVLLSNFLCLLVWLTWTTITLETTSAIRLGEQKWTTSSSFSSSLLTLSSFDDHHRQTSSFADRTSSSYQAPDSGKVDSDEQVDNSSPASDAVTNKNMTAAEALAAAQEASQLALLTFSSFPEKNATKDEVQLELEQEQSLVGSGSITTTSSTYTAQASGMLSSLPAEPKQPESWPLWISVAMAVCAISLCTLTGLQMLWKQQRQRRRYYEAIPNNPVATNTTTLVV